MKSPLVELEGLDVRLGRMPVLQNLSLTIEPGVAAGVVGPNGSGKTTLLRVLATLTGPRGGKGRVLGVELGSPSVYEIRSRIGFIGHQPALYGELTLRENLEFASRVIGSPPDEAPRALEVVGLGRAAGRRADQSSWGMQRRVEFARLLMMEPDLVLLDEPQAGLDASATELVAAVVHQVRQRRGVVVLASHRAEALTPLTDQTHALRNGTLHLLPAVFQ